MIFFASLAGGFLFLHVFGAALVDGDALGLEVQSESCSSSQVIFKIVFLSTFDNSNSC